MSCGNPHEVDCSEILGLVYEYIDNELDLTDCAKVRQHLDECGPCLEMYGLEEEVKALVHRSCGCDEVPRDLRGKVLTRIQQVRLEIVQIESVD
jgi:mycothiol system anti-sigma-R factor